MKVKATKITRPRIKHPKRFMIIIASVIVALGLITYGVFSYFTWRGLDDHAKTASNSLKAAIDGSLGAENPSSAPSAQIDKLVADFTKQYGSQPCQVAPLFSWQQVIPALKAITKACEERFAAAVAVIDALKPVSQFLKDEEAAAELVTATLTTTAAPADYAAAAAAWKELASSTALPDSTDFKPVTDKIKEIAGATGSAYDKLTAAIASEDKVAFDLATSELQAAYAAIPGLASLATTQRDGLITKAVEAYDKL